MTRYYLIENNYVGPNRKDSNGNYHRNGELGISTSPGERNMSHEPATSGWLGTTNDNSQTAHGEFATLEAARTAAVALGYTNVVDEDYDACDVVEVRVSESDAREQWDASDWLDGVSAADLEITADTTDAELADIEETLEGEARVAGIELHGLGDLLVDLRDAARNEEDEDVDEEEDEDEDDELVAETLRRR